MSSLTRRLTNVFSKVKTRKPSKPSTTPNPAAAAAVFVVPKYRRTNILSDVKRFKKLSESEKFRSTAATYAATVRRLVKFKEFSLVEEIIEHQKKYPEITSEDFVIRLISLYGKAGMIDHARKLFDEMPDLKCNRSVKSFNALLSACIYARNFDKPFTLLRELPDKLGIVPDVVSYNVVIKGYIENDCLDSAMSMFSEMENNGLVACVITFNTLMDGFYRRGQFAEGEKLWDMMKVRNVEPNIRSYNSKLRGLVDQKKMDDAVQLFDQIKSLGVKPDVYTYNSLIKGFVNDDNVEQAKKWFDLVENECAPDRYSYLIFIPFLVEKGDLDKAFELCKIPIQRRVLCDSKMVQSVLDGLMKKSREKEAMEIVNLGKEHKTCHYELNFPKKE
ncbi:hypothetical protein ACFE04_020335 [Oxalis oulophora]